MEKVLSYDTFLQSWKGALHIYYWFCKYEPPKLETDLQPKICDTKFEIGYLRAITISISGSRLQIIYKIGVLKNSAIFTGK